MVDGSVGISIETDQRGHWPLSGHLSTSESRIGSYVKRSLSIVKLPIAIIIFGAVVSMYVPHIVSSLSSQTFWCEQLSLHRNRNRELHQLQA